MTDTPTPRARWTGRILSAVPVLMLLLSASMKITRSPQAVEAFPGKFGWPAGLLVPIGVLELLCTVAYLVPQTALLGAILVTGYLGGAIATELRVGSPNWAGPLLFAIFAWAGLWLRDPRLRQLLPLRRG